MPCRLCGSRRPRLGCAWCDLRQPSLFDPPLLAPPPSERAASPSPAELDLARWHLRLARLTQLDRPVRVALVGCGKAKATVSGPARTLYVGQLFKTSLRFALRTCDVTFVLSALHGLIDPDTELDPYNFTMADLRDRERMVWGERAVQSLRAELPHLPLDITGLAGAAYLGPLHGTLKYRGLTMSEPLSGLGIGQRLAWLKQARSIPPSVLAP